MSRIVRSDYLMAPDDADLGRRKKEEVKRAIKGLKEKKKLRKKEEKKNRRKKLIKN